MEQVRSFVAIELNDQIREELRETQELLKSKGLTDQVRWVRPGGIHVTLKFLGNVPFERVDEIVFAIRQASEDTAPFTLGFSGLGCFPGTSRPNVIWIGVGGDTKTLIRLQGRIEDRLGVLGFPPEKRKYTPHLTLGRVNRHVSSKERGRLGGIIQRECAEVLAEMEVREVNLMKSVLSPTGAKYSKLAVVRLEGS